MIKAERTDYAQATRDWIKNGPFRCRWCLLVVLTEPALARHESSCPHNPHYECCNSLDGQRKTLVKRKTDPKVPDYPVLVANMPVKERQKAIRKWLERWWRARTE